LLGEGMLKRVVASLMGKRLEAFESLEDLPSPIWPHWQQLLVPQIRAFVDNGAVRSAFDDLLLLKVDGTLARAEAAGDALAPHITNLLFRWDKIQQYRAQGDWVSVSTFLHPLRASMKIVGRKGSWSPADPKAIIKELRDYYDSGLGELGDTRVNLEFDRAWAEALPDLRRLLDQVLQGYSDLKGNGRDLDYDDLESGALKILRDFPAVRARWQAEIKAILVDEYQDTNLRQRDLVNLIAGDGGKLFIVGDAKQSIYRFRGADVAVFRAERARIGAGDGRAFQLTTSYRAHRDLLSGLNSLLRPVLGEADDPEHPWREPFSPLTHHREEPKAGISAPFIELHLTVGSKGDGALVRAARAVTSHILDLVEGEGSIIKFGDIAILCRASTSFGAYESALDRAGVPYLTVAGRGFYDRPEIRDLLNMLQAVADPADNLALFGLLRSPAKGFSDDELYQLFESWEERDRAGSLWQFLQETRGEKAIRATQIVGSLSERAGRIPVAGVLERFVNMTDYHAALVNAGNPRAARNVAKLIVDAHNSGIVGIGEFLAYVSALRSGPAREGEAPATVGNVVRIMTVHAAKGLEFPVVIIGDIGYQRTGGSDLLLDPKWGVFPKVSDEDGAVPGMFRLLQKIEQDKEEAESDRLLYVAATRAQEKLILNGCISLNKDNQPNRLGGWLKKLDVPLELSKAPIDYNVGGDQARQHMLKTGDSEVGCAIYEPEFESRRLLRIRDDDSDAKREWTPALLANLIPERRSLEGEEDQPERFWQVLPDKGHFQVPGRVIGILTHEALAAWRFPGAGFKAWMVARARSHGLTDEKQISRGVERVETLLDRFKSHELFSEMDSADRRLTEVPYDVMGYSGHVEHRKIDALFLKGGKWTLVDYKTDEIEKGIEVQNFVAEKGYESQVKRYAVAVERFIGQRPRTILCLLDYQGEVYLHPKSE
ncbi:MAG: UvrD-helicase domain-containing protein, partial [Candidatus Promineifilaceae bacterium]